MATGAWARAERMERREAQALRRELKALQARQRAKERLEAAREALRAKRAHKPGQGHSTGHSKHTKAVRAGLKPHTHG